MDADTTSTVDDGIANRQPEEAVSSTTEDERPMISAAEGHEAGLDADSNGNEGTVPETSFAISDSCLLSMTRLTFTEFDDAQVF